MAHTKYYTLDGVEVPSVTTIIGGNLGWNKNALIAWSKRIALCEGRDSNEITKEASEVGTLTHHLCECRIKNETPDISSYPKDYLIRARNGYLAFRDWEAKWKPEKYLHSELQLVSEKYRYGGTIDIIVEKDNAIHLLDIKTSNYTSPEMVIQLAAYRRMYEEVKNKSIKSMGIIKLSKDVQHYDFFPVTEEQYNAGWEVFKGLLEVQKYKKILDEFGKRKKNE